MMKRSRGGRKKWKQDRTLSGGREQCCRPMEARQCRGNGLVRLLFKRTGGNGPCSKKRG